MRYCVLTNEADADIALLMEAYRHPAVARYISLDEAHYWHYVTTNENVLFEKVYDGDCLVAAVHGELSGQTLYMDIMVLPQFQNRGIGTAILQDVLNGYVIHGFERIEVAIDVSNIASLRLFEKSGFQFVSQKEELRHYVWQRF